MNSGILYLCVETLIISCLILIEWYCLFLGAVLTFIWSMWQE